MLTGACVCPQPPLLVPAVSGRAAADTAPLRAICLESVRRLTVTRATRIAVVGPGPDTCRWDESAGGSLASLGVEAAYGGADHVLPASLTVGAYLLDETGWTGERRYLAVGGATSAADAVSLGKELTADEADVAVLVMADGSAKRSRAAPGYLDPRADGFDRHVVAALTGGESGRPDLDALVALDARLADELWAVGVRSWQVLAGAGKAAYLDGASVTSALRYDEAPYGVGYFVVDWTIEV